MNYICNVDKWLSENFISCYNSSDVAEKIIDYQSPDVCLKQSPYSILQIQPETCLYVDADNGLTSIDENYYLKFINFFKKSFNKKYDLVLTPEYSVPLKAIEFLADNKESIKFSTLYCLGCEGVSTSVFDTFLSNLVNKGVIVCREVYEHWRESQLVCCLIYITKIKFNTTGQSFEKVFAFPQFKTTSMKDTQLVFETRSLSTGSTIFSFGKNNEVRMLSIICSDVFNYDLLIEIKNTLDRYKMLIFHPQLNSKPLNDYFRFMHNIFINYASMDMVRIISLNWAKGTQFLIDGEKSFPIENSWSGIYNLYLEKNIDEYINIVDKEAKYGLNLAHDHHVLMCYFSSDEHILDMNIRQLASNLRPFDIQDNIPLNINSVEDFEGVKHSLKSVTFLCEKMIDEFFRSDKHFDNFFCCDKCKIQQKNACGIGKLNSFISLVLNEKLSNQFEIINDGKVTSITSKHYKSKYSRDKVYITKRILHLINTGLLTPKFKCGKFDFTFCVLGNGLLSYNVQFTPEGFDTINLRVIYLKYADKKTAERLFDKFYQESLDYAENLIIYYEDETGVKIFPEDENFDVSITSGGITHNQASILGGR